MMVMGWRCHVSFETSMVKSLVMAAFGLMVGIVGMIPSPPFPVCLRIVDSMTASGSPVIWGFSESAEVLENVG